MTYFKDKDYKELVNALPMATLCLDPSGIILESVGKHQKIFSELLGEEKAVAILIEKSQLESKQKKLTSSLLPFESTEDFQFKKNSLPTLLPLEFRGEKLIFKLHWSPYKENFLLHLEDFTDYIKKNEHDLESSERMKIIDEILTLPKETYKMVFKGMIELFDAIIGPLDSQSFYDNDEEISEIKRALHTIKGNARQYDLSNLCDATHIFEGQFLQTMADEESVGLEEVPEKNTYDHEWKVFRDTFLGYQSLSKKLGLTPDSNDDVIIKFENIKRVETLIKMKAPDNFNLLNEVVSTIKGDSLKTLKEMLTPMLTQLPNLAFSLDKITPMVWFSDPGHLQFKKEYFYLLENIFGHLIRNSLDHGLENKKARLKEHKNPRGSIFISLKADKMSQMVKIIYFDDGKGLALNKLKKIGLERKQLREDQSEDLLAISNLIFEAGLSSKKEVSDISGRGIGMDAVKDFLIKNGGSINLKLASYDDHEEEFMNFQFVIELPLTTTIDT